MSTRTWVKRAAGSALRPLGLRVVEARAAQDVYLHQYDSYEQYRDVQISHNRRKIGNVWADEQTLALMCDELRRMFPNRDPIRGLCHGARNGFEQNFISTRPGFDAIGSDISPTAADYPRSVQWDFHDPNPDWTGRFDFVYSNSLDQSWNPRAALTTWLGQLAKGGCLVIEHTDRHGPEGASEMDPFGVRPMVMPYVLAEWFGDAIAVKFLKSHKPNKKLDVWLFFIRPIDIPSD